LLPALGEIQYPEDKYPYKNPWNEYFRYHILGFWCLDSVCDIGLPVNN
jgi:hypothetical protein